MALLAGLSSHRDLDGLSSFLSFLLSLGFCGAAGPGLHVLDPGLRHRHSAAGTTDAALARRSLSRLSVPYQSVLSVAAASMIPTRRAALAQSGDRFSGKVMLKMKGAVT